MTEQQRAIREYGVSGAHVMRIIKHERWKPQGMTKEEG